MCEGLEEVETVSMLDRNPDGVLRECIGNLEHAHHVEFVQIIVDQATDIEIRQFNFGTGGPGARTIGSAR